MKLLRTILLVTVTPFLFAFMVLGAVQVVRGGGPGPCAHLQQAANRAMSLIDEGKTAQAKSALGAALAESGCDLMKNGFYQCP